MGLEGERPLSGELLSMVPRPVATCVASRRHSELYPIDGTEVALLGIAAGATPEALAGAIGADRVHRLVTRNDECSRVLRRHCRKHWARLVSWHEAHPAADRKESAKAARKRAASEEAQRSARLAYLAARRRLRATGRWPLYAWLSEHRGVLAARVLDEYAIAHIPLGRVYERDEHCGRGTCCNHSPVGRDGEPRCRGCPAVLQRCAGSDWGDHYLSVSFSCHLCGADDTGADDPRDFYSADLRLGEELDALERDALRAEPARAALREAWDGWTGSPETGLCTSAFLVAAILDGALPEEILDAEVVTGDPEGARQAMYERTPQDPQWERYRQTSIEVGTAPRRHVIKVDPDLAATPGKATWIVSAANPGGRALPEAENAARTAALRASIRQKRLRCEPALGRDAAGTWREECLVIHGADAHVALLLGRAFHQDAVLQVQGKRAALVPCRFDTSDR